MLVVWKLDRLGRSLSFLIGLMEQMFVVDWDRKRQDELAERISAELQHLASTRLKAEADRIEIHRLITAAANEVA